MKSNLPARLSELSQQFAADVIDQLRRMSLQDIERMTGSAPTRVGAKSAPTKLPRATRGGRRTEADFGRTIEAIIGVLKKQPGLRAEQIRETLGLTRKDIDAPIAKALEMGRIKKTGQLRGTRYFVR